MPAPLQIRDMDAQQIAEGHVVERYLAGQLSESESEAFEAYVEVHPEIIGDIETVARMKSGLAALNRRGELAALLKAKPAAWRHRLAAVAAAVALVFILVVRPWHLTTAPALMAQTLQELKGSESGLALVSRIAVSRARTAVPQTHVVELAPSAVEVTLELFATDPLAVYSIRLEHVTNGALETVAQLAGVQANSDGNLVLFLRGDSLSAGDYLFKVSGASGDPPSEFALRVARAKP